MISTNFFFKKNIVFREITCGLAPQSKIREVFVRSIIRYPVRLFGFKFSYLFLSYLIKFNFGGQYEKLIFKVNYFSFKSFLCILNNDYEGYLSNKKEWIHFVEDNDFNKDEKEIAVYYKSLINKFDSNHFINYAVKLDNETLRHNFFVYGPNSVIEPPDDIENSILILTKLPLFTIKRHGKMILFLNSQTSDQLSNSEIVELTKFYNIVLKDGRGLEEVSILRSIANSELASSMGLNRILRHLILTHKNNITLSITGFDLYTKEISYSGKILSALSKLDIKDQNYRIIHALWKHDFIFNFLEIKDLFSQFSITNSEDFKGIVELNPDKYWELVLNNKLKT